MDPTELERRNLKPLVKQKIPLELPAEEWTRDEAIAVMCRSLAYLLDWNGMEGSADAVRVAEGILRRPTEIEAQRELRELREENERLRNLLGVE